MKLLEKALPQGKGTYRTAGVAILTAVVAYLVGDATLLQAAIVALLSGSLIRLRAGVKRDVEKIAQSAPEAEK